MTSIISSSSYIHLNRGTLVVFSAVILCLAHASTVQLQGHPIVDFEIGSGQYIVVFKNHSHDLAAIINRWEKSFASSNILHYHWHQEYRFAKFVAARLTLNATALRSIREDPAVKYVEVNREMRLNSDVVDDVCGQRLVEGPCIQQSTGGEIWGLSRISMRTLSGFASAMYTYLEGDGVGVDVYVVDTGVYPEHEEFAGRASVQFVASDLVGEGATDEHGHGTHVSGTIAGKTYGIAKSANIIGVKVLDKNGVGTLGGLLEGLEWLYEDFQEKLLSTTKMAKAVVNLSLGGAPGEIETLDEAAITLISEAGLPIIVAAGNDGTDACIVSPARVSAAITAGSTNKKDLLSSFSNFGPCVDILAPGEFVLSSFIGTPTSSATMSGTSMSTPHVTGVVARYLSQACTGRPSPSSIKAWVQDMATKSVIDLQTKLSTPNRLLYMFCLAKSDTYWTDVTTSDDLFVYMGIALIVVLGLLLLTFVCLTYRKVTHIATAQSQPIRQRYAPPTYNTFSQSQAKQSSHPAAVKQ